MDMCQLQMTENQPQIQEKVVEKPYNIFFDENEKKEIDEKQEKIEFQKENVDKEKSGNIEIQKDIIKS